jgi:hypothetical protein
MSIEPPECTEWSVQTPSFTDAPSTMTVTTEPSHRFDGLPIVAQEEQ